MTKASVCATLTLCALRAHTSRLLTDISRHLGRSGQDFAIFKSPLGFATLVLAIARTFTSVPSVHFANRPQCASTALNTSSRLSQSLAPKRSLPSAYELGRSYTRRAPTRGSGIFWRMLCSSKKRYFEVSRNLLEAMPLPCYQN